MNSDKIKQTLSMREVAARYGFEPNRAGFIACPFHDEHTPSLKIYPHGWKCFGCGLGGSVVDFVMQLYRLDFKQAILKMTIDFGIADEFQSYHDRDESRRKRQEQARQKQQERDEINRLCSIHCTLHQMAKVSEPGSIVWCFSTELIDYVSYRIEALQCRKTD